MASSKRISIVSLPGSTGEDRDGTRLAREWKRRWREEQRSLTFEEKLKILDDILSTPTRRSHRQPRIALEEGPGYVEEGDPGPTGMGPPGPATAKPTRPTEDEGLG